MVGSRVRYVPDEFDQQRAAWGNNLDPRGVLSPSHSYTVERIEVHAWHTKVWLAQAGGPFNSTHFEEAEEMT